MPVASKTNVFTSASAPWAGTSSLFQRKETPAALPTLTVISRAARMRVWAGAMRVSWLTSCPSARTEIHVFSVARMTRVKGAGGFAESDISAVGGAISSGLIAELLESSWDAEVDVGESGDGVDVAE